MYLVTLDEDACIGCGECAESCPAQILGFDGEKASITGDACDCMGCETCVSLCPADAYVVTEM